MYQEFSIFSSIPRVLCDTYCRYRPVCSIQAQSRPVPSIVCFLTVCINHCRLALTTVDTFSGTLHRRGCFIASRTTVKLELHSNRRIQYTYETSQIRLTVFVYPLVGFRLAAFLIGRVDMYGVGVQDVSGNLEDEGGDFDLDARWAPWNGGLGQVQLAWLRGELSNAKRAQQRVLVFSHCPFEPTVVACRTASLLWNYPTLLQILQRSGNVVATFSGVLHACFG